jgi:hypothetical protein
MRLLAVALISAAALAYEVLLARLFAIIQGYHFAYMIISMALLGYGASGSLIALVQDRLRPRADAAFATLAALFGVAALACFGLAERLPFNPLELIWDPRQLLYLLLLSGLLAVPFFCAAGCMGLALTCFPAPVGQVYRADLLGAGAGALGILGLLFLVLPAQALELVAALGPLAAALVLLAGPARRAWPGAAALAGLALLLAAAPDRWSALQPSPYKSLSRALTVPGATVEAVRSSPLGLVSAVRSGAIPLRHVPGQSLASTAEPAAQIGLFVDGEGPSPITAFDGNLASVAYLDLTLGALPYHLLKAPEVLILGAGGGTDVLLALSKGAARIDAVELNPQLADLVAMRYADFAGGLYQRPEVRLHIAEARRFVATSRQRYDLIQLPLLDSFAATSAGNVSLHESFVYTVEAIADYLDHLAPGGYLAISRWLKLPPRDSLKLFLTALTALERTGVPAPERRLALLRSWDTTLLLVRNGPLGTEELARIRAFADKRSFDLAWLPGLRAAEANRYNILPQPWFFEGARALAGPDRDDFLAQYKFNLAPATDERPYFFDFFEWRALPELWRVALQSGSGLLDWGYLILFATLVQAALLSLVLILLPLWLGLRTRTAYASRWRVAAYFGAIGLAFLFVEIAAIQRFTLFLGHPLYAVAVVLAGFLVFAGVGSGCSAALARRSSRALELAIGAIALLAIAYLLVLPPLFRALLALPDAARIGLGLALIAPLAFAMGMPFPLALAQLKEGDPDLVPWAWAVNGCASVLAAILATLLAISLGTTVVMLAAVLLYLVAAWVLAARPAAV